MWEDSKTRLGFGPIEEPGLAPAPVGVSRPVPEVQPEDDTSFAAAWQPARQLYGTTNVLNRHFNEENQPADPNYKLESNYNELMKDVPKLYQGPLREQLVDARSAEHSWAIRDNFMFEIQQQEELAKQGWKGAAATLAAGILDEGAVALTFLGPTAVVARSAKLARALHLANKANRIAAYAVAGAAENASIEAISVAASHTRSPFDIGYAAAFGGLFGAAAGSLMQAPRIHPKAPEPEVSVHNPDTVKANDRALKDMDQTIEANARGDDNPIDHPVLNQFNEDEAVGLRQTLGEDPLPEDVAVTQPVTIENLVFDKNKELDVEATASQLPPVAAGYTRLYRAESPTVKFEDVFDTEKLYEFSPGDKPGQFYTDNLSYADYFRTTYGKDASLKYIDVRKDVLEAGRVKDGYVIDTTGKPAKARPIAEAREPKMAKQAALDAEEIRNINAKLKEFADEEIAAPVQPTLTAELEKVKASLAKAAPEKDLDPKSLVRQRQELTNQRRHFMTVLQKEDPDTYAELGLGRNPSAKDFELLIKKGAKKLTDRVEKAYKKDLAAVEARYEKIDKESAKLANRLKVLEAREAVRARLGKKPVLGQLASAEKRIAAPEEKGSVGASAAIVQQPKREIAQDLKPHELDEFVDNAPQTPSDLHKLSKYTSFYSRMISDPSSSIKWITDKLLTDHIAGDGRVTTTSANVIAQDFQHTVMAPFTRDYLHARDEWAKGLGLNWLQRKLSNTAREREFGELVTDAIEGFGDGVNDPNVQKAVAALRKVYADAKDFAESAGLEGFDQFAKDPNYTPHVHNSEAFRRVRSEYELAEGVEPRMEGWTVDEEGIYQALRRGNYELDPETAALIARNYCDIVIKKDAGRRGQYFDMSRIGEDGYIESTFKALGFEDDDAQAFINLRDRLKKPAESERVKYAKRRTLLNMATTITARKLNEATGQVEVVTIPIKDLFERDAGRLVHGYVRSVGGRAAIAEATKGTAFHVTSDKAWNDLLEKSRQFSLDEGIDGEAVAKSHAMMDMAYQLLVGIPQHDNDAWTRMHNAITRWNFVGRMGQTAFAQMSEQGNIQAQFGTIEMIKRIPEMALFYSKRGADGRLTSELSNFIENEMAAGADAAMGRGFADHITDVEVVEGKFSLLDEGLRTMERIVGKPMVKVMAYQQRMFNISMLELMGDVGKGNKVLSQVTKDRFAAAGLSEQDLLKVAENIGTNGRYVRGKLVHPEHEAWGDYGLWLKYRRAMFRMTRQAVQENDISNLPVELHKSRLVKLGTQFRTFQIGAIQKQLLNNIALVKQNPKSIEAWVPFAYQTMWAGLAYSVMTELKGVGKSDADKKEWRKKMLTPERIASAAFARSGFSTVIPGIVDTALWVGGVDPVFGLSRGSGLQQNFITGNPTVQLAGNTMKAARGVVAPIVNPDYKFSRQDSRAWQSVLPFSTLPGFYNLWNLAPNLFDLPTSSTEE